MNPRVSNGRFIFYGQHSGLKQNAQSENGFGKILDIVSAFGIEDESVGEFGERLEERMWNRRILGPEEDYGKVGENVGEDGKWDAGNFRAAYADVNVITRSAGAVWNEIDGDFEF